MLATLDMESAALLGGSLYKKHPLPSTIMGLDRGIVEKKMDTTIMGLYRDTLGGALTSNKSNSSKGFPQLEISQETTRQRITNPCLRCLIVLQP